MIDEQSSTVQYYPSGTFFVGLGRPWTGIRAYDTLRRDAAMERIPFTAKRIEENATVKLHRQLGSAVYEITYFINMSQDTIHGIGFTRKGKNPTSGKLTFTYAQELTDLPGTFEQPILPAADRTDQTENQPRHWLLTLLENTSGRTNSETAFFLQKRRP